MAKPIHFRLPLLHRPWITGKLYDDYTRPSILHLDAWVIYRGALKYLVIDCREGGKRQISLDAWLIEEDGLTPVWDAFGVSGVPVYWGWDNRAWMRRIHKTVLAQAARMLTLGLGRWARVVVQAHYVRATDTDCEIAANRYRDPKPYAPRQPANLPLPDVL